MTQSLAVPAPSPSLSPVEQILQPWLAGDLDRGWHEFFAVIAAAEEKSALCLQLGSQLFAAQNYALAREVFKRASAFDRDNPQILRWIAQTHAEEGNEEEARKLFAAAVRTTPKGPATSAPAPSAVATVEPAAPAAVDIVQSVRLLVEAHTAQLERVLGHVKSLEQQQQKLLWQDARRRSRETATGQRRLKVAFFMQTAVSWIVWESLFKSMSADARFDPRVVVLPFNRSGFAPAEKLSDHLLSRDISFTDHRFYDVEREAPDVVFYQLPYEDTQPEAFRLEQVRRVCPRIAYTPYGLELGGGPDFLRLNYDIPMIRQAWRIFARSARHKRMFGQHCPRGNDHVVVTGHPKLDTLHDFSREQVDANIFQFAAGRKLLLYTPHWAIKADGSGASTFQKWSEVIFDAVESRSDCALIFRPHPLLFATLNDRRNGGKAAFDKMYERVLNSESILLDQTSDYRHALYAADGLLSDLSSLLLEFATLGKPLAYLHNPKGPGLSSDGEIVTSFYTVENREEIAAFIEMVSANVDPLREQRLTRLKEFVYLPEGGAAAQIKEHIFAAIRDEV